MKSLADIGGLNNMTAQKVVNEYSFNVTPSAIEIQRAILSRQEPNGLVEARQYLINSPSQENPKAKGNPKSKGKVKAPQSPTVIDPYLAELEASILKKQEEAELEYRLSPAVIEREATIAKKEAEREQKINNPTTQEGIDNYLNVAIGSTNNKISNNDVSLIKKDMSNYINSPLYAQRQSNFGEQYIGGESDRYQKNKYESTIAKNKRDLRLSNLNTVPVNFSELSSDNYFDPKTKKLILSKNNLPEVVAHELTHASARDAKPIGRIVPESDRVNTKYYDSVVAKKQKSPISAGLNTSEMNKFVELAKDADKYASGDEHSDKNSDIIKFSTEQYGDLMGVRNLLYKSGITKSFGEQLNKEKMDKALKDKNTNASPILKRLLFRYGVDNLIELNNTIAMEVPVKTSQNYIV